MRRYSRGNTPIVGPVGLRGASVRRQVSSGPLRAAYPVIEWGEREEPVTNRRDSSADAKTNDCLVHAGHDSIGRAASRTRLGSGRRLISSGRPGVFRCF